MALSPPPWPQPHPHAENFDLFWVVRGLPPDPFPEEDYDYGSDIRFGPPGTRWVFTLESLWNRKSAPGASAGAKAAIERLFKKLAVKLPPAGSTSWATPTPVAPPAVPVEVEFGPMMRWIRTQIVGKIGVGEELVHVHNWRHSTVENQAADALAVKILGTAVRNAFFEFFQDAKTQLTPDLTYTEVRASLLEQAGPGEKPTWPLPTQVIPFGANMQGAGQGTTLPYEVALGLSLNTNWRGTSRFRGRTYLGPLSQTVLTGNGLFNPAVVGPIGTSFGVKFLAGVEQASDYELHVVSQKFSTSAKVQGVRVGQVPDSQRRRRRDQVENYVQVWGDPVGAN